MFSKRSVICIPSIQNSSRFIFFQKRHGFFFSKLTGIMDRKKLTENPTNNELVANTNVKSNYKNSPDNDQKNSHGDDKPNIRSNIGIIYETNLGNKEIDCRDKYTSITIFCNRMLNAFTIKYHIIKPKLAMLKSMDNSYEVNKMFEHELTKIVMFPNMRGQLFEHIEKEYGIEILELCSRN
jgi:hypothetical protein